MKKSPVVLANIVRPDENVTMAQSQVEKGPNNDDDLGKIKTATPIVNASVVFLYSVFAGMFIIGWIGLNSCPLNKMIPIYLIVAGSTGILTKVLLHTRNKYTFGVLVLLILFDVAWQVLGSYIVYGVYQPNYDPEKGPYCQRTAYLVAFWMITVFYSMTGLFLLLSACYFLMRNTFTKG